ncbi:hypothetical protein JCGZ_15296 [Jatropha curcas]|uniref:Transmembrane protein n=2 Tax=Jatropha curcas TaxID=180498 RepID=A0A067LBT5_JATCU|nr:hypothetical protein JCGZ_15296 [Jatropha curcas]
MLHCHHHTLSPQIFPFYHHNRHRHSSLSITSFYKPTSLFSLSALPRPGLVDLWLSQLADAAATTTTTTIPITPAEEGGPIELPFPSSPSIFATTDDPSPLQVATSVLLTGAIAIFLFRSVRRRAKRAKELKFRSSGVKKSIKEEALDSLKAMGSVSIDAGKPPSPVQTLLGGISAGVIALILYKFTTTIEAALNRQTISDSYSVRQITITIRTIINGLCYLATFVFGLNSVGLFLYSGQLAINSFMEDSSSESESKGNEQSSPPNSTSESAAASADLKSNQADQNTDNSQQ